MSERERDGERAAKGPGVRPAGLFRAVVLAAVAAAAPVAGCYESGTGDDAAADGDVAAETETGDGASDDGVAPVYGVPDADDSVARYAAPMYGAP